jgi:hypothetical protein
MRRRALRRRILRRISRSRRPEFVAFVARKLRGVEACAWCAVPFSFRREFLRKFLFRSSCGEFDATPCFRYDLFAGWSSLVARRAHNPEVVGSNPTPATIGCLEAKPRSALFSFRYAIHAVLHNSVYCRVVVRVARIGNKSPRVSVRWRVRRRVHFLATCACRCSLQQGCQSSSVSLSRIQLCAL